jgi:hypothetical protein
MAARQRNPIDQARRTASANGKPRPVPPAEYPEGQRGEAWEDPRDRLHGADHHGHQDEDHEPVPQVVTVNAEHLVSVTLPEPVWAVKDILPAGLSLLAGKPKLGKSWLAMSTALAVAHGGSALGRSVEAGAVLYLALEDTQRRLQDRLRKLLSRQNSKAPARLDFATEVPRQDNGGLFWLADWLDRHRDTRLVVIDTWGKFRPAKVRGVDEYEFDYQHGSEVKKLADKYGAAVLAVCHCRKMEASDPVDSVRGSVGVTGCADGILVLRRERGQHDAALFVSGRDVEETELALRWEAEYCHWSALGDADEYRISKDRADVLEALRGQHEAMTPTQIAPLLGKSVNATKKLLWTMQKDGQLLSACGKYLAR